MLHNSLLAGIPGTGTFLRDIPGKNGIVGSYGLAIVKSRHTPILGRIQGGEE